MVGLSHIASVLADSSSEGEGRIFVLALPIVVAVVFWGFVYRRYRNQDARYEFENTSGAQVTDVRSYDQRVKHRTGLSNSTIEGRNDGEALADVPLHRGHDSTE